MGEPAHDTWRVMLRLNIDRAALEREGLGGGSRHRHGRGRLDRIGLGSPGFHPHIAAQYADAMARGAFGLPRAPIWLRPAGVKRNGERSVVIVNGSHRIAAVASGATLPRVVVITADPRLFGCPSYRGNVLWLATWELIKEHRERLETATEEIDLTSTVQQHLERMLSEADEPQFHSLGPMFHSAMVPVDQSFRREAIETYRKALQARGVAVPPAPHHDPANDRRSRT